MNKFVRTKSPTGSKFSKIFFQHLYTGWIVVVHLYGGFSLWRQMAPQQSAKFRTAFFGQFHTSLRNHSVAHYASIGRCFRRLLRDQMYFVSTKHFADPSVGGATTFAKLRSRFCKA